MHAFSFSTLAFAAAISSLASAAAINAKPEAAGKPAPKIARRSVEDMQIHQGHAFNVLPFSSVDWSKEPRWPDREQKDKNKEAGEKKEDDEKKKDEKKPEEKKLARRLVEDILHGTHSAPLSNEAKSNALKGMWENSHQKSPSNKNSKEDEKK